MCQMGEGVFNHPNLYSKEGRHIKESMLLTPIWTKKMEKGPPSGVFRQLTIDMNKALNKILY